MAGKRQPTAVVVANGRKHLTRAEIDARQAREIQTPPPAGTRVTAPKWLAKDLRPAFNAYAKQLVALGIFGDLDKDTLGRYLVAQDSYQQATEQAGAALTEGDLKGVEWWSAIQDRYFKQAEKTAADLGLNVSARCRLVVPKADEGGEGDDFMDLLVIQED